MRCIRYSAAAAVLLATILMGACKKSSNSTSNPLIGTWELTNLNDTAFITLTNSTVVTDTSYANGHSVTITINSNKTYTSVDNLGSPATTDSGSYSTVLAGKLITQSAQSGSTPDTMNYTISGSTMKVISSSTFTGGYEDAVEIFAKQ